MILHQATPTAQCLACGQTGALFVNPNLQLSTGILMCMQPRHRGKRRSRNCLPPHRLASVSPHIITIRCTACFIHSRKVSSPQRDQKYLSKIISNILLINCKLKCVPDPRGSAGSGVQSYLFIFFLHFLKQSSVPGVLCRGWKALIGRLNQEEN